MLAIMADVGSEYDRRATPPSRFVAALTEDGYVVCQSRNCELPMVIDPQVFSNTRAMVREWRRNNTEPIPLRFLKLAMKCLNGHVEFWHAEPVKTREAAAAASEAEEQRYRGMLTAKTCTSCGESYDGNKYSRFCADCRVAATT
jgi:hypothetical protein